MKGSEATIMYSGYCIKHWPLSKRAVVIYKGFSLCESCYEKKLKEAEKEAQ